MGAQASTNVTANVTKIIFTKAVRYADGKLVNSGRESPDFPIWTPDSGVNNGPPVCHPRKPAFQMSFAGTNIQASLLGTKHTLTRVQMRPPLYKEASSGMVVWLNHEPSDDTNVVKSLEATVSLPALGVRESLYGCEETKAGSSIFAHKMGDTQLFFQSPSNAQPAKVEIAVRSSVVAATFVYSIQQAGDNAFVYSNEVFSIRLLGNPAYFTTLKVSLTQTEGFSNTVVQFNRCGRSIYQNYEDPTPTNAPPEPVPEDAGFYVEVHADSLGKAAKHPILAITMDTEEGEVEIGRLNLVRAGNGVWQTVKPAVVCMSGYKASDILPSDRKSYLFLEASASAKHDGSITATLLDANKHPYPTLKSMKSDRRHGQ